MALTQGAWTKTKVGLFTVYQCDVTATTAENDAYTLPLLFDNTRPATIVANSASAALDGTTLPVDLWIGLDTVGLTGDSTTVKWTADNGYLQLNAASADVQAAAATYSWSPALTATNRPGPYMVINLDGGSTLNAATCHFIVLQPD